MAGRPAPSTRCAASSRAKLTDRLGKSVIVENRPGAGSVLGVAATARAAPDGYTMVMAGSASLATTVTIYKKLPYDPMKEFSPLALITRIPFVLVVNPSLPVKTVLELIALAKKDPGRLSYASGGPGSPHHLFMELFKSVTGTQMLHVPYKGTAPAINDVIGGQVPVMFGDVVASLPLAASGKVRPSPYRRASGYHRRRTFRRSQRRASPASRVSAGS